MCGKHNVEKGDMKTRNIITAIVAGIGGIIAYQQLGNGSFGLISALNVAVMIGVAGIFVGKMIDASNDKSQGFVVKDEMTLTVEGKASKVAFTWGNYVWLALIWYEFAAENFISAPKFGSPAVMLVGLLVNIGIYFTAYMSYRK